MKALGRYAIASIAVVLALGGAIWPFLDERGHAGLFMAAVIVLPVQWGAFGLVASSVGDPTRFLSRWAIGFMVRMAVVVGVGLTFERMERVQGSVLLLAICGFFFALLLLDSVFFLHNRSERFAQ